LQPEINLFAFERGEKEKEREKRTTQNEKCLSDFLT